MKIIPAIDIIDGQCVRLHKGAFESKKVYGNDPVEMAQMFEANGFKHLHVVDLDGARAGAVAQLNVLEHIANNTDLHIDFGGGVKTTAHVSACLDAGASQITAGSIAVRSPELVHEWIDTFGPQSIILGADARDRKIAISGWEDTTDLRIEGFIDSYKANGITDIISTDVDVDGTLEGPAFGLYRDLVKQFPTLNIIASGGVGTIDHIHQLKQIGVAGVIVGKAIYEGRISLTELSQLC